MQNPMVLAFDLLLLLSVPIVLFLVDLWFQEFGRGFGDNLWIRNCPSIIVNFLNELIHFMDMFLIDLVT